MGYELAEEVAQDRPGWRSCRMIPNESGASGQSCGERCEHPVWQLAPMQALNTAKSFPVEHTPITEDVDFMRPDGADQVEPKREVQKQECIGVHGTTCSERAPSMQRTARLACSHLRSPSS